MVSAKKASVQRTATQDISDDQAAVTIQKGKKFSPAKKKKMKFSVERIRFFIGYDGEWFVIDWNCTQHTGVMQWGRSWARYWRGNWIRGRRTSWDITAANGGRRACFKSSYSTVQPAIKISCSFRSKWASSSQKYDEFATGTIFHLSFLLFLLLFVQVHLYSQALQANLQRTIERVPLERIDPGMKVSAYLGQSKPPQVHKLPFNIHQEFPYFDSSYMNDPRKANSKRGAGSVEWASNSFLIYRKLNWEHNHCQKIVIDNGKFFFS